jgi:tyrosine-specific transport protein
MLMTGLLLLEINLTFKEDVNLATMTKVLLGNNAQFFMRLLYLFLFYALMLSYFSGSQEILSNLIGSALPKEIISSSIALIFGILLLAGIKCVDKANAVLMGGLIFTYLSLMLFGMPHISLSFLDKADWTHSAVMLPTMIIAFGFHNLVPTLKTYLNGDAKQLRKVLIVGSFIPLIVYILWEALILGLVKDEHSALFLQAIKEGNMATTALKKATHSPFIVQIIELFALFTILTSLITIALSFVDFLKDGIKKNVPRFVFVFFTLMPPLVFSMIYPHLFLQALGYAGAFGALIIYGIMPVLMAFKLRKNQENGHKMLLPGGNITLVLLLLFSITAIFVAILNLLLRTTT